MRMQNKKLISHQRLVNNEPLVVLGNRKKRDAPVIYHRRDGPLLEAEPPDGTGHPEATGPPKIQGNRPEMILPKNTTNGNTLALKWFKASEERNNINLNMRKMKMKNFKLKRLFSLAFIGCLSAMNAPTVFAAAGDTISNTATLTFDVGGTATVLESSPTGNSTTGLTFGTATDFLEDNLINFTVATTDLASVSVDASATGQVLTFTVTNNGNGAQDFSLSAINAAVGDPDPFIPADLDAFDPASFTVVVESGDAVGYDVLDVATYIDELAPLGVATVYIVSTMPVPPLTNDDLAVMTLVAQVAAGDPAGTPGTQGADITTDDTLNPDVTTTEEDVFNDAAGDLNTAGAADVIKNGQHSDTSSYIVGAAILTVAKTSVTLWDPVNANTNPKSIPGAYVRYTITVGNDAAAGASGSLTSMADTLAAALILDPDFVNGTAVAGALPAVIQATNTNGVGESFDVAHTTLGAEVLRTDPVSCTSVAGDGCAIAGQAITIDFALLMPVEDLAPLGSDAGEDYAVGELKPGQTITIMFNVIVQ